jgi:TetR/AcrR family transcriptional regulator, repressor of fatR-cypB operon
MAVKQFNPLVKAQEKKLRKKQEQRMRMLKFGFELATEKDIKEVSVQEICKKVGTVPSNFFHYFTDKEEFNTRIISNIVDRRNAFMVDCLDPSFPFQKRLKAFLFHLVRYYISEWRDFMFLDHIHFSATPERAKFDLLDNLILEGIRKGYIRDMDAAFITSAIYSFISGVVRERIADKSRVGRNDVEAVLDVLFNGISTSKV